MTLKNQIMKLQTYKMYEDEDTVYVERDDVLKALEQQLRDCKTCKHSDNGNCAYTEECRECMWESKYEQQQKTGHWILGVCDECEYDWGKDAPIASVPNFCPNCGCRMIEPQESESDD